MSRMLTGLETHRPHKTHKTYRPHGTVVQSMCPKSRSGCPKCRSERKVESWESGNVLCSTTLQCLGVFRKSETEEKRFLCVSATLPAGKCLWLGPVQNERRQCPECCLKTINACAQRHSKVSESGGCARLWRVALCRNRGRKRLPRIPQARDPIANMFPLKDSPMTRNVWKI